MSLNWQDNNAMHAKPDLRVVLEWTIAGSGSVIADVIPLKQMHRPRFSIFVLLATVSGISILIAIIASWVNAQRRAVAAIDGFGGSAYCNELKLDNSFATNLRCSVTCIEVPEFEMLEKLTTSIERMACLKTIVVLHDYQPAELDKMRRRFPRLKIAHGFEPLFDLIQ